MSVFQGENPQNENESENKNESVQVSAAKPGKDKGGFFAFRTMVTPAVIRVLYVLGAIALLVATIFLMVKSQEGYRATAGQAILLLLAGLAGQLVWRVSCEMTIVIFSIHEELVQIRKAKQNKE